jgi:hypothetical protein
MERATRNLDKEFDKLLAGREPRFTFRRKKHVQAAE